MRLKIALVATKCDSAQAPTELSCEILLDMTANHLESLSADVFLVNEVIMSSSQKATKDVLENIHCKVALLCSDPRLKAKVEEMRPLVWHKFLVAASKRTHMSLDAAHDLWENEKEEVPEDLNLSSEQILTLKSFYNFTAALIEEEKSEKEEKLNMLKSKQKKRADKAKNERVPKADTRAGAKNPPSDMEQDMKESDEKEKEVEEDTEKEYKDELGKVIHGNICL